MGNMNNLTTMEMMEQLKAVLILDVDHGIQDDDLPDMIQQLADRMGSADMHGPLTPNEMYLHPFCPEYNNPVPVMTEDQKIAMIETLDEWLEG